MKIIKLQEKRQEIYSNLYVMVDKITTFHWSDTYNETIISYQDSDLSYVKETPEQIIELIKGATEI